jgi:hypothetical protein
MEEGRAVTLKLEHPHFMVGLLFGTALLFGALLEFDNWVLDHAIVELRYCQGRLAGGEQ